MYAVDLRISLLFWSGGVAAKTQEEAENLGVMNPWIQILNYESVLSPVEPTRS
jgi:hypothetical protein